MKFATSESAGKAFKALHGWWFDGKYTGTFSVNFNENRYILVVNFDQKTCYHRPDCPFGPGPFVNRPVIG